MNLGEIKSQVHATVLKYRRLERIVNSREFSVAFQNASPELDKLIESCDCDAIESWLRRYIEYEIGEYSIRQLRQIAQRNGVSRYSLMNKSELLSAILGAANEEKGGTGKDVQRNGTSSSSSQGKETAAKEVQSRVGNQGHKDDQCPLQLVPECVHG